MAFLPGHGTTIFVEGIHFVVDGDQSHLPVICKENAEVGAIYQGAGGPVTVTRIYRLTEAEAAEAEMFIGISTAENEGDALRQVIEREGCDECAVRLIEVKPTA